MSSTMLGYADAYFLPHSLLLSECQLTSEGDSTHRFMARQAQQGTSFSVFMHHQAVGHFRQPPGQTLPGVL